jgi:hypothetical protein
VLLLACACSSGDDDASALPDIPSWARVQVDEAPEPGTWKIERLSDEKLKLGVGEETLLRVRVTDASGEPMSDLRLSFALVGLAQDSGLAELDAVTDADGVAKNQLIAGLEAATFAVRVSTPGAYDVMIAVAVSGAGFGSVTVDADYDGKRAATERIVFAQPRTKCEDVEFSDGLLSEELAPGEDEVVLNGLPAGVRYAVAALAQGESGTTVAKSCVDDIRVAADATTEVESEFIDEPFMPVGQFSVKVELDAASPASTLASSVRSAAELLVNTDGEGELVEQDAEARFMLDALEETLARAPYAEQSPAMTLAAALTSERMSPSGTSPETSLQQLLDGRTTGPLVAIPRIADTAEDSLADMELFAAVTLDENNAQAVVWQARRIQAQPTVYGGPPPSVDLARLRVAADVQSDFLVGKDILELSKISFRAELGALTAEVLKGAIGAVAESSPERPDPFGCMALGEWLGDQSLPMASACDADCLRATCEGVIARISDAAETALVSVDADRPTLQLHGDFKLQDDNGDLLADAMSADLSGEWLAGAEGDADAVEGVAEATVITDSSELP